MVVKNLINNSIVAGCGLCTMVLVSVFFAWIHYLTGFNLFTFSIWFVLPVGAVLIGALAASGYYFGAVFFNIRPTVFLLIQIVIVTLLCNILIFYLEYQSYINLPNTNYNLLFSKYLDIRITHARYFIGRISLGFSTGKVGTIGYLISFLHFLGFILGGLICYAVLAVKPYCKKCYRYFSDSVYANLKFDSYKEMFDYSEQLFQQPIDHEKIKSYVERSKSAGNDEKKRFEFEIKVQSCKKCFSIFISEDAKEVLADGVKRFPEFNNNVLIDSDKNKNLNQNLLNSI